MYWNGWNKCNETITTRLYLMIFTVEVFQSSPFGDSIIIISIPIVNGNDLCQKFYWIMLFSSIIFTDRLLLRKHFINLLFEYDHMIIEQKWKSFQFLHENVRTRVLKFEIEQNLQSNIFLFLDNGTSVHDV